ncbi:MULTISPECIES: molybdopterin converting factor subunit 1 [Bacillaceae]|jgi:molybdopterin converting factor subunit 1|uniref:Molybdopterin synthase sulfur carrier subunit n=1 Tax=Ectobacillus funiculus TaxID=137993 RepID=A0ABV5W8S2_9BACI|nr:molybdopterin converting factor subunit 1 [Ectobacillus funiculus]
MITVLLFAHLREQFGTRDLQIEENSITVADLRKQLEEKYEFLDTKSIMIAVNEEFADDEDVIQAGDTVALIPPVSGG